MTDIFGSSYMYHHRINSCTVSHSSYLLLIHSLPMRRMIWLAFCSQQYWGLIEDRVLHRLLEEAWPACILNAENIGAQHCPSDGSCTLNSYIRTDRRVGNVKSEFKQQCLEPPSQRLSRKIKKQTRGEPTSQIPLFSDSIVLGPTASELL